MFTSQCLTCRWRYAFVVICAYRKLRFLRARKLNTLTPVIRLLFGRDLKRYRLTVRACDRRSPPHLTNMPCCSCKHVFLQVFVFIKMCIVSTGYLFSEMLSPFKRMSSKYCLCSNFVGCGLTFSFFSRIGVPDRKGEYAVITGGNRGIGWYTVKGLVGAGMKVIVGESCGKIGALRRFLDYVSLQGAGMVRARIFY